MQSADIVIRGAREHNLRDVDVILPKNRLICLTGVSGSGKSSLAFDTLYAEGQRRYIESLSSFARQFLGQLPKPDVDHISGLSPSISIAQKSSGQNPRSTVGTITEIHDYLRVLFARCGQGHCPQCGKPVTAQSREQILERILGLDEGTRYQVLAPLIRRQKGEYRDLFEDLLKQGFVRARVDGRVVRLDSDLQLDRRMRHDVEVVVDRLQSTSDVRPRLAEAVDVALRMGEGNLILLIDEEDNEAAGQEIPLSAYYACPPCGISFEPPTLQLFSFNSPQGMCRQCDGLGYLETIDPKKLIPDPSRSFQQGAIVLFGRWRELGRWKRHIYKGVAEDLEEWYSLERGTVLETAWEELPSAIQEALLFGTGERKITYTWRKGRYGRKHRGPFEGVIPPLLAKYRRSRNRMQRRMLEKYMSVLDCPSCHGERLNEQARAVTLTSAHTDFAGRGPLSLPSVSALSTRDAADFFGQLQLDAIGQRVAAELLKEIRARLGFLLNVGLDYLTLSRRAPTLSGGESQRIRLASQIGSGLVGVLYVLDEPSIGLHPRDNDRLLQTLVNLRDMGNTVVVVEHDEDTMRTADCIVDFGPGPGVRGGEVVASGDADEISASARSVTGSFLSGERKIDVPESRRPPTEARLRIVGARHNNLKDVDVEIPLGTFVCVTGVSGSGKSSLVNDILVKALRRDLNHGEGEPGDHDRLEGLDQLDKMIAIDQTPIGRTPRSNPGTYIKVFDDIRRLFTQLPEAKARGYAPGRFSFNVDGGRCQACEGNGSNRLEMDFLADVWVTCPVCEGHRFNRETLQVRFKGKSIADVLEMDVQEALEHFENITPVRHKLQTLHDVGLDYLKIGQPSPTLSGGEAQRIKLARELVKKSTGRTIYLLDEPTTGLHFADIEMLLKVLHGFVEAGNTVLVVEHNLDVIKTADYVIDLGPEGGQHGGQIIACGTPEEVVQHSGSRTGQALRGLLEQSRRRSRNGRTAKKRKPRAPRASTLVRSVEVQGARQHNLKSIDVSIPRDRVTVCCGLSGSGKTSLAMDTVYAEGQRRYVESLSSYARQFVSQVQKPELDHISGLSPAIALEQKNLGNTPRSTVGTVTEIYDYLRVLYARLGEPFCPDCDLAIGTQTSDQIVDAVMALPDGRRLYLMAPLEVHVGERYEALWDELRANGYQRVRVDAETFSVDEVPAIDRRRKHRVEAIVDRVVVRKTNRSRIADSIEKALELGRGVLHVAHVEEGVPEARWQIDVHSQHFACRQCGRSFDRLTPHSFSFNSPLGWCESCEGLGTEYGANPAALLDDPEKTLSEGAVAIWPQLSQPLAEPMIKALADHTGLPLDVPYNQLGARHRRILLHGTGDDWISVPASEGKRKKSKTEALPRLRFQYKGLFPALEEAARLSPKLRTALDGLTDEVECSECGGSRVRDDASAVRFAGRTIDEICRVPLGRLLEEVRDWQLSEPQKQVAGEVRKEIENRLSFLVEVGLEYLTLGRPAPTLSGGEAQRIRLAAQVGSGLTGVLYVLDEPTIGLHPRDNQRLIGALAKLRDLGNTLLLVEHDREVVQQADHLLDFGPAAGRDGGQLVAQGTPAAVAKRRASVTGPYLNGRKAIPVPTNRRMQHKPASTKKARSPKSGSKLANQQWLPPTGDWLEVIGARQHNLKEIDVAIPLGALTTVTGVSGSGKSSLIDDVLYPALARRLHRSGIAPGAHDKIVGINKIDKVIRVDQQPLGNSPSSNPATYTGVFDHIRKLFAQLPESKVRGYTARRFSFNVPGGRCETCEGNGQICVEMHFLPDVWITCETCRGQRYNPETLSVLFHGHTIADVLALPCGRAVELFENIPKVRRILQTLCDVGLDYVTLGQAAPTLSGGEAQRVKLAAELSRPDTGRTLYLLDEPTTGLHFDDLARLLDVLHRLVDMGNTVVVIEHHLDLIKTADWIIDLGPEAGADGGQVVVAGTPEQVVERAQSAGPNGRSGRNARSVLRSYTGELLASVLVAGPHRKRESRSDLIAIKNQTNADKNAPTNSLPNESNGERKSNDRSRHTRQRTTPAGEPCQWDGRILEQIVDRLEALDDFAPADWSKRSVVEIKARSGESAWFMRARTGDATFLVLKLRVGRNVFDPENLEDQLDLGSGGEIAEANSDEAVERVVLSRPRGPWQEVQLRLASLDEIDHDGFWKFLDQAVESFRHKIGSSSESPDDLMPWKALGRRWHVGQYGFDRDQKTEWDADVLEQVSARLQEAMPDGRFDWSHREVVYFRHPKQEKPLAIIHTKRRSAVDLLLRWPKGKVSLDELRDVGFEQKLDDRRKTYDVLKLRFREVDHLAGSKLHTLLEHQAAAAGQLLEPT